MRVEAGVLISGPAAALLSALLADHRRRSPVLDGLHPAALAELAKLTAELQAEGKRWKRAELRKGNTETEYLESADTELMSVNEAARILDVTPRRVRQIQYQLGSRRVGGRIKLNLDAVLVERARRESYGAEVGRSPRL